MTGAPERAWRVLIAGGGTGGHLFPGLAIAEAFLRAAPESRIRFVGSAYGLERQVVPARGFRLHCILVRGLYRVPLLRKAWVLAMLPVAFLQCLAILLLFRPHLVIGVGGYASGPMLATAVLFGQLTVIQEQNAYPGITNRLLGRRVRHAFVPVSGLERFFPRASVVGNPVRREILALREAPPAERPVPQVFIIGGSQGARRINEAVVAALPLLKAWGQPLRLLHQTGAADLAWVQAAYARSLVAHQVVDFIEDMAAAYHASRLIVSRAGASAMQEIVTAGRAALLIPIPDTSGDHQRKNAQRLEQAGAALLLEQAALTGETLARRIVELLGAPQRLDAMEQGCDALFSGDAAARIVAECLALMQAPRGL